MMREFLSSVRIKEVMSSPVITVMDWDDFHVVYDKFEAYDIRHLPVLDSSGRITGLISQRHLYKICSPRKMTNSGWYYDKDMLDAFILKNVMVKDVYVLRENSSLAEAMRAMVQFKFGCIPIVDDLHRPVGIITRDNILNFFLKTN